MSFSMRRITKWAAWIVLVLLGLGAWSCRPQEVVVEKPVTRIVTQPPSTVVVTVEQTVERAVIVTVQETVQVVVTSTL